MATIRQDPESWQLGYQDGLEGTGKRRLLATDGLAYNSGVIEGRAIRLAFPKCAPEETVARVEQALERRRRQGL